MLLKRHEVNLEIWLALLPSPRRRGQYHMVGRPLVLVDRVTDETFEVVCLVYVRELAYLLVRTYDGHGDRGDLPLNLEVGHSIPAPPSASSSTKGWCIASS
jgi:hypothetical protein